MSREVSEITVGSEHNGAARGSLAALEGAWRVSPERSTIGFRVKKMGRGGSRCPSRSSSPQSARLPG